MVRNFLPLPEESRKNPFVEASSRGFRAHFIKQILNELQGQIDTYSNLSYNKPDNLVYKGALDALQDVKKDLSAILHHNLMLS